MIILQRRQDVQGEVESHSVRVIILGNSPSDSSSNPVLENDMNPSPLTSQLWANSKVHKALKPWHSNRS